MLAKKRNSRDALAQLLDDPRLRQAMHEGRKVFAAADAVAILSGCERAEQAWAELLSRHPEVAEEVVVVAFDAVERDALDVTGVVRLIQAIDSPYANRLKQWIVRTALERLEEADDPELALVRTRQAYEQQGYSRQWIDQRMRSVSARHELTSEWYRRGARDSDQFRDLTNEMMRAAFGMDVEHYRRYKGLFRTRQNLRDHMTDLELSLTSLAETTAVELARQRRSSGFDALLLDAKETGQIIAGTRAEIERHTGRPVVTASNHLAPPARPARPAPPAPPAPPARSRPVAA